jgi:cell wall-associated NlpC family hydrolase
MRLRKKICKLLISTTALTFGFSGTVLADGRGEVRNDQALVVNNADMDADVIAKLDIGQTINVLDIYGDFFRIALDGAERAFILDKDIVIIEADAIVVGDNVAVREFPDIDSEQVGSLSYGDNIVVTGIIDDFYRVQYEGQDYFIHIDYVIGDMIYSVRKIDSEENFFSARIRYATLISSTDVNLRTGPSTDAAVAYILERNGVLTVLDETSYPDWIKVQYKDRELYVNREFALVKTGVKPDTPPVEVAPPAGLLADEMIAFAMNHIGTPYVWGGTSLTRGVDCSGFTFALFREFGIHLNRTAAGQATQGTPVARSDLQRGDLVFFGRSGIFHVGMYIGNNQMIHSGSGIQWGISISNLGSSWNMSNYATARRIIN